jgi:hypothetical protein
MLLNRTVAVYRPGQQVRLKQKMTIFYQVKGGQVYIFPHIGWEGRLWDRALRAVLGVLYTVLLPAVQAGITLTT